MPDDTIPELDALLADLKAPAKATYQPKHFARALVRPPDALVLGMVRTTCACCHSVTEYPSSHLLVRYGRDYKWSGLTIETADAGVPLEVKYVEVSNAHCIRCFPIEAAPAPDSSRMWQHGLKLACEPAELAQPPVGHD